MKKVLIFEEFLNESTTSWSKMMKGVKAGESGPWSLVAIENNKVVGQRINIQIRDILPAEFEAFRKEYPKAKIHIEDSTGGVVWNEQIVNEANISKLSTDQLKKMIKQSEDERVSPVFAAQIKAARAELKKRGESTLETLGVNEAKTLTRDALMDLLENKYKIKTVRTSEEFNGQTEGIWMAADNEEELSGNKIFDYYNRSAKYTNGVLKTFRTAVEKTGWWFEWNDPGTIIIWPNN